MLFRSKGEPLFAFGYGLSYTDFEYGKAKLSARKLKKDTPLKITVPVKNAGKADGDEVVQIYLRRPNDSEGPLKALRGFKRVNIAKGKTANVEIELRYKDFEWFDTTVEDMRVLKGKYEILYGGSSRDCDLKVTSVVIE